MSQQVAPTFVAFGQEWRHVPPLPSIGDIRRELVSTLIWFGRKPLPDIPYGTIQKRRVAVLTGCPGEPNYVSGQQVSAARNSLECSLRLLG